MAGFCSRCGKRPSATGRKYCSPCARAFREYQQRRRAERPEGNCTNCLIRLSEAGYRWCGVCRAKQAQAMRDHRRRHPAYNATYLRERNRRRRSMVLDHYGGHCACCGEGAFEFLALDHINNDGQAHREEVGSGARMVEWIIKNDYPPIFRVLCHNCNQARGYYGACPHERELRLIVGGEA